MISVGVLLGAAMGYIVYQDATARGQDRQTALLWTLGTVVSALGTPLILLGFLALYYFVGRTPQTARKRDEIIDVNAVPVEQPPCPRCGQAVKEEYRVCPYCSQTLKPSCKQCGAELQLEWKVCPHCGASLTAV